MFTLLSRILNSLAASPTQLLMTLMTLVVGVVTLPAAGVVGAGASARVASEVFAAGAAEVVGVSFVVGFSGSGSAGAYSYTTSFLGFSVGLSLVSSVGFSVGLLPS